jgi:(S)-2-hydroxyglutarate dehydrogenase
MSETIYDVTIVGGGIVGLATAYKLNMEMPQLKVLVLEKEKEVGAHQTGHNSGVIHSGLYYKPGSYKAIKCVEGRRELVQFAKEHNIKHDICGKIVVATKESELEHMHKVFQHGTANGVEDIEIINADQIKQIEPYCTGIAGIRVGCTGIIDYADVARKYETIITQKFTNSKVLKGHEAIGFTRDGNHTVIKTIQASFKTKYLISTAGLQADRVAKKEGHPSNAHILGFRGDYYDLSEQGLHKVKHLIYPVPNPEFPFLGVHFTRMIHGGTECGPNAVFVFKREGYKKTDFSMKDTLEAFSHKGTWKFFAKHWRFGIDEYRRAFSKKLFLERLRALIPSLEMQDLIEGRAGVRAMALTDEGKMLDDFKIEHQDNVMHVINSPSPAATASLAYGGEIARMAKENFNLK